MNLSELVRPHFPALQRRVNGHPAAFFDGPAGSQVPQAVADAVADSLLNHNANTEGAFVTSEESDRMLEDAREYMADFLGAASPREIVFGANMTTMTFAFSRALRQTWKPGDEVVVTALDHQANIVPWERAAEEAGATVRTVPFDPETCLLDYEALENAINERTRLVAVGYASNAVGTINDVQRVATLAREAGALSFIDAVHFAPHGTIDVQEIGCDFLACSAYKFFGPHVGVLWGREPLLEEGRPFKVPPASDAAPDRWETGTLNHEGIVGAAAAVEWIAGLAGPSDSADRRTRIRKGMTRIEEAEAPLFEQLLEGIAAIPGTRIYGPPAGSPRTPTLGLTLRGHRPQEIAQRLGEQGIFVWDGDFYATSVIERLGLAEEGGLVRIGFAPYNTGAEVERLVDALARI